MGRSKSSPRREVYSNIGLHKKQEKSQINNLTYHLKKLEGFPGGAVVKNPPANEGDTGSSPGPGRSHMPWSN